MLPIAIIVTINNSCLYFNEKFCLQISMTLIFSLQEHLLDSQRSINYAYMKLKCNVVKILVFDDE